MQNTKLTTALAILAMAASTGVARAQVTETYRADATETKTSKTGEVRITIKRWSSKSERHELIEKLLDDGPEALLDGLHGSKTVGTLRTQDGAVYELRYAHQLPAAGKIRRILIATDRPLDFWATRGQPPSLDQPFTFVELRMKTDGSGEGMMSIASRISTGADVIEFDDYSRQPIRLEVKLDKEAKEAARKEAGSK